MTLKYLLEKEFKQFFRHKFMPKLVVLFPLMIMVLMPWATTLDIKDINTIVVDHDASTMSSDLVKAVNASSYFRLRDVTESYEQAVDAMEFGDAVHGCVIPIKNRPDIFVHQYIMDEEDGILGEEENLLLNATTLSLEDGTRLCRDLGGVCFPAHIDRTSNGAVAVLGTFPDWLGYTAFEISASGSESEMRERLECLKPLRCLKNSDAHYLWDISEEGNTVALEDEPYSGALVRKNLLRYIDGENDAGGSTI